ncbi:exported hypothetical protein [Xanthomonas citri pv. fuscans]|nr:exported hypothetical protein [Xanthomonas citri pv. fuscans]
MKSCGRSHALSTTIPIRIVAPSGCCVVCSANAIAKRPRRVGLRWGLFRAPTARMAAGLMQAGGSDAALRAKTLHAQATPPGTCEDGRCGCGYAPFAAPTPGRLRAKPAAAPASCDLSASQRTLQVQGGARYRAWPGGAAGIVIAHRAAPLLGSNPGCRTAGPPR